MGSLPIVSVLGMIWLWGETRDPQRLAAHSEAIFWLVLPSLPMFLLLPALLRRGVGFPPALAAGLIVAVLLYLATAAVLARFGVRL